MKKVPESQGLVCPKNLELTLLVLVDIRKNTSLHVAAATVRNQGLTLLILVEAQRRRESRLDTLRVVVNGAPDMVPLLAILEAEWKPRLLDMKGLCPGEAPSEQTTRVLPALIMKVPTVRSMKDL